MKVSASVPATAFPLRLVLGASLLLAVALLAACNLPRAAAPPGLPSVGVARVDITPDYPTRLTGFAVRKTESEGVTQRIHAKALAIGTDSEGPAVLVTVDNLGVSDAIRSEVLRRLADTRLVHDRLAICSSHTHSAPMLAGVAPNIFMADLLPDQQARVERYTRELTMKLEQVIRAALADRRPSRVEWSQGKAGFAMNRRGKPIAPVDHDLPVLRVTSPQGWARAVFVSYACHCVTLGLNTVHGDWAGSAQLALEADHPGAIALVAIGCGADQNPNKRGTPDLADAEGRQIADEVKRLFTGPWKELSAPPFARTKRIELDFDKLPTRAEWEALATNKAQQISYHAKKNLARLARGEPLPTKLPYLVQTWHFGTNLALVFLPGEVVVDYGLRLKREFDASRLWVHGYSNDDPCYIPSERVLQEGGYEGGGAMVYYDRPTKFASGLENKIIGTVHELLPRDFIAMQQSATTSTEPRAGDLKSPSVAAGAEERRLQTTGTENIPPKSPAASLATIRTKPGLTVELVAAEPLVTSPVAIDFGTDGKLWVVEMADYPMGLDGNWKPGGRVKFLTRSRPDGPFDRATLFLDGLPFPTGVMAWRKGVLICAAPDILYAEDTDGDGKADIIRKLYTGFETNNYQARVNSLSLGLDNWVHGANGLLGGDIQTLGTALSQLSTNNPQPINIRGRDFRFRPDTGEFELTSGLTQQGRARDDFGNWFGCNNSQFALHYPLPDRYLARNPHVPAPSPSVNLAGAAELVRLFPVSTPLERFNAPQSLNRVTSACGLGVYRDTLLGAGFSQNLFICEPVHNMVRRLVLTPDGVTFTAAKPADEAATEFLASTDNWFRPVQALTGPDGALWVVDMYRFVIEHPRWIPPERLKSLDVRAGADKGRIYRIYPQGAKLRPVNDLTRLTTTQIVAALDTENGAARDRAHRELLHRKDPQATEPLAKLVTTAANPAVRLQALVALNAGRDALPRVLDDRKVGDASQVGQASSLSSDFPRTAQTESGKVRWSGRMPDLLLAALADSHPIVRQLALHLSEPLLAVDSRLASATLKLVSDSAPTVRYQLAFTLGTWNDPRATAALVQLARDGMSDPYQRAAILSGAVGRTGELLKVAVTTPATAPGRNEFLGQLIATASASASDTEFASLLTALAPAEGERTQPWQLLAMTALQDAFDARGIALRKFAESPNAEVRAATARLQQLYADARAFAANPKSSDAMRRAAVPLLGRGFNQPDADALVVAGLLVPPASAALQQVALTTLRTRRWPKTDDLILAEWSALPVALRPAIVDALSLQETWTQSLLNAVERGVVGAAEIPPVARNRFRWHGSDTTKARVAKLFPEQTASRAAVIASYANIASLKGDAAKGGALFTANCAACHAYRGLGHALGPDLATFRTKPVGDFLTAILDPNAAIEPKYIAYNVDTKDDRALTGLVVDETAIGFTLAQPNGVQDKLLRSAVKTLRPSQLSLMPEGLEAALPPQAMADLIAWLRE